MAGEPVATSAAPVQPGAVLLRPPTNPVDRRAVGWWTVNLLIGFAVPVVVLVVLGLLITPARFWLFTPAVVIAFAGLAAVLALPRWWFRVHRWEVTDTAVYTRTGRFWQEWRVAPLSRIQTVDTRRGPLEQRFGLATVVVTTASAKGAVTMPGLARDVAEEIAERLTVTTQAIPGDAT
ncbi:PH domain-containing protein [Actinoplanes bogorensis]|uniref:PH domain-containing protein n=1 Tax=Paractinoplanes bogorensis TaxID=1610840 RepID=A0ABS5YS78_9ACTN|nr:PH domain-containing protein [Actinoplanes bogorensis]MBU2666302.1 PH domain-containing protein [Actinoplanes bogorensis]